MRRAVAALIALLLAAAVAVVLTRGDGTEHDSREVTREQLVRLGVRLGPPDRDQPVVIARERAENIARNAVPSPVLGSVLATCHENEADVGYPCWAVAHDPAGYRSGGPPGAQKIPAAYFVSIVDSRTGAWVRGEMGGDGGPALPSDRASARDAVENAIAEWQGRSATCRDGVRPDFRGRPVFGCAFRAGRAAENECYAVLGDNLFRMGCATARTDTGRLVFRG